MDRQRAEIWFKASELEEHCEALGKFFQNDRKLTPEQAVAISISFIQAVCGIENLSDLNLQTSEVTLPPGKHPAHPDDLVH